MSIVKTILFLSIGFILGQQYMNHAYDMNTLEIILYESVEESYRLGCLKAYLEIGKQFDLNGFCDYNARQHRHDYEDIVGNKIWEKK